MEKRGNTIRNEVKARVNSRVLRYEWQERADFRRQKILEVVLSFLIGLC